MPSAAANVPYTDTGNTILLHAHLVAMLECARYSYETHNKQIGISTNMLEHTTYNLVLLLYISGISWERSTKIKGIIFG